MKRKISYSLCLLIVVAFAFVFSSWEKNNYNVDLSSISSGDSQVIAILDTGLERTLFEENKGNIVKTFNVKMQNTNIDDEVGHGTALTTTILGSKKLNYKGILPKAKVILIKITDENGKSSFSSILKGLEVAEKYGATVINISLGGDVPNENVTKKINDLYKKNIAIVASSGDYGEKDLLYPANLSNVISVSSVDHNNKVSDFSNYNKNVTCSFQGESISMISINDGKLEVTDELSGTSYAAIYASGYAAALKDYAFKHDIRLNNKELYKIMKEFDPMKNNGIILDMKKIF